MSSLHEGGIVSVEPLKINTTLGNVPADIAAKLNSMTVGPMKMTYTNIVICGGDLVGKSTVMENLMKAYNRAETHHGTPVPSTTDINVRRGLRRNLSSYWDLNRQIGKITIMDRVWTISDLIYNPKAEFADYVETMALLKEGTVLLVILTAEDPTLLRMRFDERGDEFVNIDQIIEYNLRYKKLAQHFANENVPFIHIKVDGMEVDGICGEIGTAMYRTEDEIIQHNKEVYHG